LQSIVVIRRGVIKDCYALNEKDGAVALNFGSVSQKTSAWTADHVARIGDIAQRAIPVIGPTDVAPVLPSFDLWDLWPVQTVNGQTADFDGWSVWMILSAPKLPNPDDRHDIARIRMVTEKEGAWRDCGNLYPDDLCPGSREWAGSALYDPEHSRLISFHTAAGRRGAKSSFEQRIFQASATLTVHGGIATTCDWTPPTECFQSDGTQYVRVDQASGIPGQIKGFRDPAHFRDPADGVDYLLFTGSLGTSTSDWNGVIGIARSTSGAHDDWQLLPPIVSGDGLNNEQERPHIIFRDGHYYVFWSTQSRVFASDGPIGPTGLYGMVAPALLGPYTPLNGSGLVAANPAQEPFQTYSWWVTDDLEVAGFIDLWGLHGQSVADQLELRRRHFGGTPAPRFRLVLDGESAHITTP
jgi:levansucrase